VFNVGSKLKMFWIVVYFRNVFQERYAFPSHPGKMGTFAILAFNSKSSQNSQKLQVSPLDWMISKAPANFGIL
jgi:hypothetical protein